MLGSSLLTCAGPLLLACVQEVAARPRPVLSYQSLNKRETILDADSTCTDIQNYQTEQGQLRIQMDTFDLVGGSDALNLLAPRSECSWGSGIRIGGFSSAGLGRYCAGGTKPGLGWGVLMSGRSSG